MTESTSGEVASREPILEIRSMSKTFPGTRALDDVSLDVYDGEIHALVGTNGSGKSTLIKVLAGYHPADEGSHVAIAGVAINVTGHTPVRSSALRFVHQDLGLVLELDVLDNLALHGGFARTRSGAINWREQRRLAEELLAPFEVDIDIDRPLAEAAPVERTVIAIIAALQGWNAERGVLVLDEPTAVLPPNEVARLFTIIKGLRARGISVLYVSHRLDEIFEIADRVTVLRGGRRIMTEQVSSVSKGSLINSMLGKEMSIDFRVEVPVENDADTVLEVRGLRGRYASDVSFSLRRGEILGLAGLAGSGREEVPYALAGALNYEVEGAVRMPTKGEKWTTVGDTGSLDLAFVPADRGTEGIVDGLTVAENLTLSVLDEVGNRWFLSKRAERRFADEWASKLQVKMADSADPISTLSGGNQQKVLIGRCLVTKPEVLVLSEPTAGVDVGARRGIFELLTEQAGRGLAVIVASTDLDDLLSICSRVLVFQDGIIAQVLEGDSIQEDMLVKAVEGLDPTEVHRVHN